MTMKTQSLTQSQKLMVFVLTMSLYGLATLFTELIPSFQVGIVEFSVENFLYIPLVLAMLFDPMSAALGAATGELVFREIYIAGRLVRNPQNRKMVGAAAISGVAIQQILGMIVDIMKVQFAVEDFEAVPGLPQSVFATEGFSCLNDILFSGILFCLLPTLFLVPKLYGKIEPLLGMEPRTEKTALDPIGLKVIVCSLIAFAVAAASELLATSGLSLIDWEAGWAESGTAMAAGMVVAALIAIIAILVIKKNAESPTEKA